MSSYLPFGQKITPTNEQVKAQQIKFERYDYYGIPYGQFDTLENEEGHKEKDREEARLLIMKGESIPKDLENRLLQYKKQEHKKA
mgnify:FL=1